MRNFLNYIKIIALAYRNKKKVHIKNTLFNKFYLTKSIFIHIPKTAGTSIVKSIYNHSAEGHKSVIFFKFLFGNKFNNFFKFCIVRNPYTRLYSAYMFLKRGGSNIHDINAFNMYLKKYENFEDFVVNGLSKDLADKIIHFKPQASFICDKNGSIYVDFIARFENIKEDYDNLKIKLNISNDLAYLNDNKKDDINYVYTTKMKKIVTKLYKEDFKLFNYKC